jgi:MSHA biogenesis protein MshN
MVLAPIIALAFFIYGSHRAAQYDAPQIVSKPIPVPVPVAAPKPPAAPPEPEPPAQTAAFNPVSRLSADLSFVAPVPVRKEKSASAGRTAKPAAANSLQAVVRAPAPQADKSRAAAVESVNESEALTQPAAVAPERVAMTAGLPSAAEERVPGAIDKQVREVGSSERAEIAFRKGAAQLQAGSANAAELDFREALKQDPSHPGARQALLGLLLDSGRNNEAEQLLRKALDNNPRQPRHAMVLARLEVERGELTGAINTMVSALPYVQSDPDFFAFLAALLQRDGRHREAVDYYRSALLGVPGNGVWMMGLGISLRATNQSAEARDTFQRAIESKQLTPELQEFVARQLSELSAQRKK